MPMYSGSACGYGHFCSWSFAINEMILRTHRPTIARRRPTPAPSTPRGPNPTIIENTRTIMNTQAKVSLWMQTLHSRRDAYQEHSDDANAVYCEICDIAAVDLCSTLEFVIEVMKVDSGIESMDHLVSGPISTMLVAFAREQVSEALSELEPSSERDALREFVQED